MTAPLPSQGLVVHLCEYASIHRDGTFSLIRGGAVIWWVPPLPHNLIVWVFVEAAPQTLPEGPQHISLRLRFADLILANIDGEVDVVKPELPTRLGIPLSGSIQAFGTYLVDVSLGELTAQVKFEVRAAPVRPEKESTDGS